MSGLDLAGLRAAAERLREDVDGLLVSATVQADDVRLVLDGLAEAEQYIDMLIKARDRAEAAVERVEALATEMRASDGRSWVSNEAEAVWDALHPPLSLADIAQAAFNRDQSAQQVEVAPEGHPSPARAQSASSVQPMPSPYASPVGDDGADGGRG